MNVVVSIVGLGFLILIHEAGHFFTARAVGMRPRKFYVGFPPPLVKTVRSGIEYGVGTIPLGGYVKIPGMYRPASSDLDVRLQRTVHAHPELAGPFDRAKHDLDAGDEEAARRDLDDLEAAGVPASELADVRDSLAPDAYWKQSVWRKVAVIFAGPGTNLLFALVVFTILFVSGGGTPTTTVDQVLPNTPAERAGLRAGDRIVTIDGRHVKAAEIPPTVGGSHGRALVLAVVRDGRTVRIGPARPQRVSGTWRLGFALRGKGLPLPQAAWQSVKLTGAVSRDIVRSLGNLVHSSGRKQISSPVGIVQGESAAVKQGWQNYLFVLGLISLSLALLNLLPLLPLDGGHIAISLLEWVRRRPVPRALYERLSAFGIAVVLLLFFVGLSNDLGRLGGG